MDRFKDLYNFNQKFTLLVKELRRKILKLNPKIEESFRRYYISYKLNKCFAYLWFSQDTFWVYLKTDKSFKDTLDVCEPVPRGVNATFDKRVKVDKNNMNYVFSLIKKSYQIVSR